MPSEVNPPTIRAGAYARYSSDHQRDASIDDQVRLCRAEIERQGWDLVQVYADPAISGASTFRPGYQKLLLDASTGAIDVVVAESLDRLSRDLADVATLYKHLSYLGVRLWTVADGQITELHVGLKGTMNALYLKDLAQKTHRGLEGRVRSGMSGGGICYGYDLIPGQTGARKINQAEAVVVRIFEEYAAGRSPQAITTQLNKEQVPGPRGGPWRHTTIRGHITRGTGILNNELYVGRLVWNRQRFMKDPASGRRRSRRNDPGRLVIEEVPDLRIVDDELWNAVKTRQTSIRESEGVTKARGTRFWEQRRAQHLLTGLVYCGSCGSRLASVGRDYLACSAARGQGTCANRKGVRRAPLEELIVQGLRQRLMAPEMVEEFVAAFHEEVNRQRRDATAARAGKERELAEVRRKLEGLIDALAEGYRAPGLQQRLDDLEARKAVLEQELAADPPPPVRLHPNLGQVYRGQVERLHEALADPALRDEALGILRGLIERVVIHPAEDGLQVGIVGEIVKMIELGLDAKQTALPKEAACSVKVVAGAGFGLCALFVAPGLESWHTECDGWQRHCDRRYEQLNEFASAVHWQRRTR